MDFGGPSSLSGLQKRSSKSDYGQSAASPSRSSSAAAAAVAIFLRNNGGRETKATATAKKKKLECYCRLPPLSIKCPLHQFGSWPFRMLVKNDGGCEEKKQRVVLPITTSGISSVFANYLRRRSQKKQPSRFFFEHQARVASEASGTGSM